MFSLLLLLITEKVIDITAVGFFLGNGLSMTHCENKAPTFIWRDSVLFPVSITPHHCDQSLHRRNDKCEGKVGIGKESPVSAWKTQAGFF